MASLSPAPQSLALWNQRLDRMQLGDHLADLQIQGLHSLQDLIGMVGQQIKSYQDGGDKKLQSNLIKRLSILFPAEKQLIGTLFKIFPTTPAPSRLPPPQSAATSSSSQSFDFSPLFIQAGIKESNRTVQEPAKSRLQKLIGNGSTMERRKKSLAILDRLSREDRSMQLSQQLSDCQIWVKGVLQQGSVILGEYSPS